MSFFKFLFGGGAAEKASGPVVDGQEDYEGHTIKAMLMRVDGEYQICGLIEKEADGEIKSETFIRADRFSDKDQCIAATLAKGRQIIDEQGRRLFS